MSKKAGNKKAQQTEHAQQVAQLEAVVPDLTLAMIQAAIMQANESYKKRKGAQANLNKGGVNPDLAKALKIASKMTNAHLQAVCDFELKDRLLAGLQDATNTKKPMRTLQAFMFTATGSGEYLKGSAKTFLLEFCALAVCGVKNRAGLKFCATGSGSENTSHEVYSTIKARELMSAFGAVKVTSESTQNSVSFSKGGIAETLGVARKDSRTGLPVLNLDNPFTRALDGLVSKLTPSSISLLVAQSSERSN